MQQLLKHLAEHETKVEEMVKKYRFGGNKLLNKFMRERQGTLASNEAQLDRIRRQLLAALNEGLNDVMDTLNRVTEGGQDRTAQWVAREGEIKGMAEQALSRCTG